MWESAIGCLWGEGMRGIRQWKFQYVCAFVCDMHVCKCLPAVSARVCTLCECVHARVWCVFVGGCMRKWSCMRVGVGVGVCKFSCPYGSCACEQYVLLCVRAGVCKWSYPCVVCIFVCV